MVGKICTLLAVMMAVALAPLFGGAVITNGTGIYLGVNNEGHLNFTDGVTTSVNGSSGRVGVAVDADLSAFGRGSGIFDATSPGCWCEGWGASASGVAGWASLSNGFANVGLVSFASTPGTATSVTTIGGTPLEVTHAFGSSTSSALMMAMVTLTNTGAATITDVRYNRTMDWDVPPSEFRENVEIGGWPAANLFRTTDNGFATPNPLLLDGGLGCPVNANFAACGPSDHGAFFTFAFGDLDPGESVSFDIFYGAAFSRAGALAALSSVGAEVFSLGMYGGTDRPLGEPITYAFGFRGVGGTVIPGIPEPGTYAMMGLGLGCLAWLRRRNAR